MRLARIEAIRFGRLENRSLDGLTGGLNVVLGPNEAGKTSFTDLVRHVLYGFSSLRDAKEAGYHTDSGKRQGRLVFADDDGEWVVERVEGPRGGTVTVRDPSGSERPDLIDRVTSGVSRHSFRVVFGFGLEEMAQIEASRGTDSDVLSRLYAARTGLGVSPQDVRATLQARADEQFRPQGRSQMVSIAKREITEAKKELRDLEEEAERYAAKRERLAALERSAEEARVARDEAGVAARLLDHQAAEVDARLARLTEIDEASAEREAQREALEKRMLEVETDPDVLAAAPEVEAVLDDMSGFRERLRVFDERRARIAASRASAETTLAALGPGAADVAEKVHPTPQLLADIEKWREDLGVARSRATESERLAAEAAAESAVPHGVAGGASAWLAWVAVALGLLAGAAGAALQQWLALAAGIALVALGALWLVRGRGTTGAGSDALEREASRAARLAQERARRDAVALEEITSAWSGWLEQQVLAAAGSEPSVVAEVVAAVREWQRLAGEIEREEELAAEDERTCREFVGRLSSAAGFEPGITSAELSQVPALASKVRDRLDRALRAQAERDRIAEDIERIDEELLAARAKRGAVESAIAEILDGLDMAGQSAVEVKARAEMAQRRLDEVNDEFVSVERERAQLAGELAGVGDETRMAEVHLKLTAAQERLEEAVDRYAVAATAVALVDRAIARYQDARQPQVIKIASDVFKDMTAGRYERIVVPAHDSAIEVVRSSSAEFVPSSELSRGTQEQLYLALRIALIEQLDEAGPGLPVLMDDVLANFDPGRREGAARAIEALSRHRQVIFFTCHPDTAQLFERSARQPTVVNIDRCP